MDKEWTQFWINRKFWWLTSTIAYSHEGTVYKGCTVEKIGKIVIVGNILLP